MRPYGFSWVLMCPYKSYALVWVLMCLNRSVCVLVGPYGSL